MNFALRLRALPQRYLVTMRVRAFSEKAIEKITNSAVYVGYMIGLESYAVSAEVKVQNLV